MRHWLVPALRSVLLAVALLVLGWLLPGLMNGATLADAMLQPSYKLPELVASYIPDLVHGVQLSLMSGAAVALCCFVLWVAATHLARPAGPGQVMRSWRVAVWAVLCAVAAVAAYLAVILGALGELDTVDRTAAFRLSAAVALAAILVFWLLCLMGTERMIRPAVPFGARLLVGRV